MAVALTVRDSSRARAAAVAPADTLVDTLSDPLVDPLRTPVAQARRASQPAGPPVQRDDSDDESYMEVENEAPDGYMDPSDYYDEFGGSDHSDMDGVVWVKRVMNRPALWWQDPHEETDLRLTGSRAGDIRALGGDDEGYTWHHCADYAGGTCTMQQVPTDEHRSWGHVGGARQAGYGEDG